MMTIEKTRTLADYRPQHDVECETRVCAECGHWPGLHVGMGGCAAHDGVLQDSRRCNCRKFQPKPCTCGLDDLLAAVRHESAVLQVSGEQAKEPLNLRLHRYDDGSFVIYGRCPEFGFSGHGKSPQEAMMHWVMHRNTDTSPMWPVDRHDLCRKESK